MERKSISPLLILPVFLASLLISGPAAGQSFFKYVDRNGNVHFTDRLESVPPEYRGQIKVYKEEKTEPAQPPQKDKAQFGREAEQKPEADKDAEAKALKEKTEKERLAKEKADREAKLKARQEIQARIADLQDQLRAKQQEQAGLRTTWMVYDRMRFNQLNEEMASLAEQIQSLQKEMAEMN